MINDIFNVFEIIFVIVMTIFSIKTFIRTIALLV